MSEQKLIDVASPEQMQEAIDALEKVVGFYVGQGLKFPIPLPSGAIAHVTVPRDLTVEDVDVLIDGFTAYLRAIRAGLATMVWAEQPEQSDTPDSSSVK
jgi:hypothetical protein